jgi:phosphonate transport system substrate-binding protein
MSKIPLMTVLILLALLVAACSPGTTTEEAEPLIIGAIPDQDPEQLQRRFGLLADYLEEELEIPVEYKPVTDYAASVTAFRVGDLDLVWFGGLTGVQARLQVAGAQALVQRELDQAFHSVFIANKASGVEPFEEIAGLSQLKGRTFTFGSESSTSGRLMPQFYLSQAGVTMDDFAGEPGFSGSHDATIELVEAGTFETGALNEQVWLRRVQEGEVDLEQVQLLWRTPPFHDYHWVIRPDVVERYGEGFTSKVAQTFLKLTQENPQHKEILDLFSAERFITTQNDNYVEIETVGRDIGMIQN